MQDGAGHRRLDHRDRRAVLCRRRHGSRARHRRAGRGRRGRRRDACSSRASGCCDSRPDGAFTAHAAVAFATAGTLLAAAGCWRAGREASWLAAVAALPFAAAAIWQQRSLLLQFLIVSIALILVHASPRGITGTIWSSTCRRFSIPLGVALLLYPPRCDVRPTAFALLIVPLLIDILVAEFEGGSDALVRVAGARAAAGGVCRCCSRSTGGAWRTGKGGCWPQSRPLPSRWSFAAADRGVGGPGAADVGLHPRLAHAGRDRCVDSRSTSSGASTGTWKGRC